MTSLSHTKKFKGRVSGMVLEGHSKQVFNVKKHVRYLTWMMYLGKGLGRLLPVNVKRFNLIQFHK